MEEGQFDSLNPLYVQKLTEGTTLGIRNFSIA